MERKKAWNVSDGTDHRRGQGPLITSKVPLWYQREEPEMKYMSLKYYCKSVDDLKLLTFHFTSFRDFLSAYKKNMQALIPLSSSIPPNASLSATSIDECHDECHYSMIIIELSRRFTNGLLGSPITILNGIPVVLQSGKSHYITSLTLPRRLWHEVSEYLSIAL